MSRERERKRGGERDVQHVFPSYREYLELDLTLSQEKVQHIAGVAVAHINGFTAELRRLFLVEDIIDSIKFGVILWVFTYIGAWFNGMTLVILGRSTNHIEIDKDL